MSTERAPDHEQFWIDGYGVHRVRSTDRRSADRAPAGAARSTAAHDATPSLDGPG